MTSTPQEIVITLIGGTFLLLFLVVIIIVATTRYQNRKRRHLADLERMKHEAAQQVLKTRLEVQDKTLTDVSREIHDNIGQILSVVKLNLHAMKPTDHKMIGHVSASIDLMNSAITDLRNISKMLSTDYISTQSLPTLLQREVDVINKSQMFEMELITPGEERPIDPEKQLIIYRIAQECIQNAIKHSEAKKIQISFEFLPHALALEVADDGKGFIYDNNKQGNGLTNLNARVAIIGAMLTIKSKPGEGTRIQLSTPG